MSSKPPPARSTYRTGTAVIPRFLRAWRSLSAERRLAVVAAWALVLTLFLPWYRETVFVPAKVVGVQAASVTLSGWGAFSFVEALLMILAVGVLGFLFARAEGRGFDLPVVDGWTVTAAGAFACLLVVWRIFATQGATDHNRYATSSGIAWGILVALGAAALLTYAGSRMRSAIVGLGGSAAASRDGRVGSSSASVGGAGSAAVAPGCSAAAPGSSAAAPGPGRAPRPAPVSAGAASESPTAVDRGPEQAGKTSGRTSRRDHPLRRRFGPTVVPEDPPTLRVSRGPSERPPESAPPPWSANASEAPTAGGVAPPPTTVAGRSGAPDDQLTMPLESPPADRA